MPKLLASDTDLIELEKACNHRIRACIRKNEELTRDYLEATLAWVSKCGEVARLERQVRSLKKQLRAAKTT